MAPGPPGHRPGTNKLGVLVDTMELLEDGYISTLDDRDCRNRPRGGLLEFAL